MTEVAFLTAGGVSGLLMLQQPIVLNPNPAENAAASQGANAQNNTVQWQQAQPNTSTQQVSVRIGDDGWKNITQTYVQTRPLC